MVMDTDMVMDMVLAIITKHRKMEAIQTKIKGLVVIQPKVFEDDRGHFFEPYNKKILAGMGILDDFWQDNQSMSQKGVLRGLHFQNPPFAQSKLVRVIKGLELNEKNKTILYIPPGFAHGFKTLEDNTIFLYKCSALYNKEAEDSILWNDPDINIPWNIENPVLSDKDKNAKLFKNFQSKF